MPDPATIALSAAGAAYKICKETYDTIQGIKKAPVDVQRVATDLKGFYTVLGALQGILANEGPKLASNAAATDQVENIASLLHDCVEAFKELQEKINPFFAINGRVIHGTWEALKWDKFNKDDITYLRSNLSNMKMSLNVALGSLTLYTVSEVRETATQTKTMVQELKMDIGQIRARLDISPLGDDFVDLDEPRNSVVSIASLASVATVASTTESMRTFLSRTESSILSLHSNMLDLAEGLETQTVNVESAAPGLLDVQGRHEDDSYVQQRLAELGIRNVTPRLVREKIVAELNDQVKDWKGHRLENFGPLLLYGTFVVYREDVAAMRDYRCYLFERILLLTKVVEVKLSNLSRIYSRMFQRGEVRPQQDVVPILRLKGRIFTDNIAAVEHMTVHGSHEVWVTWIAKSGLQETFHIIMPTPELQTEWINCLRNTIRVRPSGKIRSPPMSSADVPVLDENQGENDTETVRPPWATIVSCATWDNRPLLTIDCMLTDNTRWTLKRGYPDFNTFQSDMYRTFPDRAELMPRVILHKAQRDENTTRVMNDYLRDLLCMPARVIQSPPAWKFFNPRHGDFEKSGVDLEEDLQEEAAF